MSEAQTLQQYRRNSATTLPPLQNVEEAAAVIGQLFQQNDGATYSLHFGSQSGQSLYSVSIYPEHSRFTGGKNIRPEIIAAYIQDNLDLLADPRCCIGMWYNPDENVTYLDIAVVLTNKRETTTLGRRFNQIGIFDLRRFVVIATGGTGEPIPNLPLIDDRLPVLERRAAFRE